jgi:carbamoyltransferase
MNKLKLIENTEPCDIANLLLDNNIICVFNGRSEAGSRALGNRSLIFNPKISSNKDMVNEIKGREKFRPLACSILLDEVKNWFHMNEIEESPFMTYSFDVRKEKKQLISSVIHVDDTCRIQTVTKENNFNYYSIIESFFKLTNIPLVGNTSFNLAEEPIVETIEDAIKTIYNSKLNYLYFPECKFLIKKENS